MKLSGKSTALTRVEHFPGMLRDWSKALPDITGIIDDGYGGPAVHFPGDRGFSEDGRGGNLVTLEVFVWWNIRVFLSAFSPKNGLVYELVLPFLGHRFQILTQIAWPGLEISTRKTIGTL